MQTYGENEVSRGRYTGEDEIDGLIIIDSAKSIEKYAFAHSSVKKVVIADVQVIEKGAFYNCQNLEEVVFSDNVLKIEEEAFFKCKKLSRIIFPKNLVSIGKSAFAGCEGLEKIIVYDKLQEIGETAFESCESLEYLKLSGNLHLIGDYAFAYCSNLCEVDFSGAKISIKSVTTGDESAKEILQSVDWVDMIQIGEHPFLGCNRVKFENWYAYSFSAKNGEFKKSAKITLETFMKENSLASAFAKKMLSK